MSERKVINKYYPPDFDPALIPKAKKPKNGQVTVRMMMPMSVRCNTCGEYIYKGKKFNSKKETVAGEEYLGIKIFRFYMRCPRCSSEFTIKTDPQNSDYVADVGSSRNFEPWREKEKVIKNAKDERAKEEEGDSMKALENRTRDSKVEMDILDALDEIRALNARNAKLDPEELIEMHKRQHDQILELDEKDEELVNSVVFKSSSTFVKRLENGDNSEDETPQKKQKTDTSSNKTSDASASTTKPSASSSYIKVLSTPHAKKAKKAQLVVITPKKNPTKSLVAY